MSELQTIKNNAPSSLQKLYSAPGLSWWPVIFFIPARFVFAFIAQALTAGIFVYKGSTNAWQDATAWWPVYSTITDILCLVTLVWLTKREGTKISNLLGAKGKDIFKQLAWTPLYLLAVAPTALLANIITQSYYGTVLPPMIAVVNLPPAGQIYSLVIWPIVWVITEELVYLGYLLPRIEVLSGKIWVAVLVVIFFWGFQHLAMPFIPDEQYLVSRVLAATAAISSFPIAFLLGRRRLIPLIGVHYLADLATAILILQKI